MNLHKHLRIELFLGIVFLIIAVGRMITDVAPSFKDSILMIGYLLVGFNRIYGINFRINLDEREKVIVNKSSGAAAFLLIIFMIVIFSFRGFIKNFDGVLINEFWGFFLVPIYMLSHASSGLILSKIE